LGDVYTPCEFPLVRRRLCVCDRRFDTEFRHPRFFDKLGMTGSMPQLINGILLLLTFLFVRIFYGGYLVSCHFRAAIDNECSINRHTDYRQSWQFYGTMQSIKRQIPALVYYSYLFGNAVLNFLNWLWWVVTLLHFFFFTFPRYHTARWGIHRSLGPDYTSRCLFFRFYKMIKALRKRFTSSKPS